MKFIPSVLRKIFWLSVLSVVLVSLGWLKIMPVLAVQVLSNTLLTGVALVLFAEILISKPQTQKH